MSLGPALVSLPFPVASSRSVSTTSLPILPFGFWDPLHPDFFTLAATVGRVLCQELREEGGEDGCPTLTVMPFFFSFFFLAI